jgi:hypothetical protein
VEITTKGVHKEIRLRHAREINPGVPQEETLESFAAGIAILSVTAPVTVAEQPRTLILPRGIIPG